MVEGRHRICYNRVSSLKISALTIRFSSAMIDPATPLNEPVVYKTKWASGKIWASGVYNRSVTPDRTRLTDSLIVTPTDTRAILDNHKRGAVVAQDVYAVPLDLIMGQLNRTAALTALLRSPEHEMREEHISQILDSLEPIADHYVVPA